jgi:hypothetical protein
VEDCRPGCEAVIEAAFYGTAGGVALRNVGGSFYDFRVERFRGTSREALAEPPDEWAAGPPWPGPASWRAARRFDPASEQLIAVARTLDAILSPGSAQPGDV